MATPRQADRFTSLRNLAAICGGLAGVGGITHGVGEVLQGSRSPDGIVFDSWAQGRIARNLGDEPAMTLVPNLLITGTLTILASLAVLLWAVAFVDGPHAGRGLVLLSVVMLLVGGGFGPPMLGMLAGLAAGGAHASRQRWTGPLAGRTGRLLASLWPGLACSGCAYSTPSCWWSGRQWSPALSTWPSQICSSTACSWSC